MSYFTLKHKEVIEWLEGMFEHGIPQFEVNEHNISTLHRMYNQNKQMDALTKLYIEDIEQKTAEHRREGARLQGILESVGVTIPSLSAAGKQVVRTLGGVAVELDVKNTSKSNYMLAMAALKRQLEDTELMVKNKQQEIDILLLQFKEARECFNTVKKYYSAMEELSVTDVSISEKRKQEADNLLAKTQKYSSQIKEFEDTQSLVGEEFRHEVLVKLSKELDAMKAELQPVEKTLKSYKSLPPDVNLAKVKIEEAKRELARLENALQSDIDLLAL